MRSKAFIMKITHNPVDNTAYIELLSSEIIESEEMTSFFTSHSSQLIFERDRVLRNSIQQKRDRAIRN